MNSNEFKEFKIKIEMELEENYRKGFSHGFHVGKTREDVSQDKINDWRYADEDKIIGAPGTWYEGKLFRNLKNKIESQGDHAEALEYQRQIHDSLNEVDKFVEEMELIEK